MSHPLVQLEGLQRRFGPVVALRGVGFAAAPGEVILLSGANGAGKSTLLRVVAGLVRPGAGTVRIDGHDLRRDRSARRLIGFLSHQTLLYDDLTARENLRFAAVLHAIRDAEHQVMTALDAAALTQRADQRVATFSHGMRQRLAIARATLHRPHVLLLDEPFSGLDIGAAELLRRSMAAHADAGATVICATHQPADLWPLVTRVVALHHGRVGFDVPRPAAIEELMLRSRQLVAA